VANVYSRLIARAVSFSGGPSIVYTTPAGFVTVIRCMSIVLGANVGAQDAFVALHAGPKLMWVYVQGISNISTTVQQGWWVMDPGDQLVFGTDGGLTADFYVSGHELTLP
jgi:hypothetical protein